MYGKVALRNVVLHCTYAGCIFRMYDSPNDTTQRSGWCSLMRAYTAVRYYNVNATPLIGVNKIGELVKLMHILGHFRRLLVKKETNRRS
jgi:hypothetical protein